MTIIITAFPPRWIPHTITSIIIKRRSPRENKAGIAIINAISPGSFDGRKKNQTINTTPSTIYFIYQYFSQFFISLLLNCVYYLLKKMTPQEPKNSIARSHWHSGSRTYVDVLVFVKIRVVNCAYL
jgi:hypothetical protein